MVRSIKLSNNRVRMFAVATAALDPELAAVPPNSEDQLSCGAGLSNRVDGLRGSTARPCPARRHCGSYRVS